LGNLTKGVQDSTKGALTIDSELKFGTGTSFKASKDLAKRDEMCGSLCCISIGYQKF